MNLKEVEVLVDKSCPKKHRNSHKILSIPGRDDICLIFCEGWSNRLFFVYERSEKFFCGKLFCEEIGGKDGLQIIVNEKTLSVNGEVLKISCSVLNFIGSSGGAGLAYNLGKYGFANPVPIRAT